jgi:hypothetical protein
LAIREGVEVVGMAMEKNHVSFPPFVECFGEREIYC